ncbi:14-3-3 protein [Wilcoxina mikolae CBS 423.85]|nr:14-3-3 protein [Wilcoxina mikolae CBS 423.85]
MVGSEVDHKYLGTYAKSTISLNPILSAGLYKLLGLSTLLSRKLLRARKQRKLDPTRTTKSLDLYRHIIWMAREGLTMLQNDVLPELANYKGPRYAFLNELHVLALKMNASFLHIFVLFDHTYQTKTTMIPEFVSKEGRNGGVPQVNGYIVPTTTAALSAYAYMAPTIEAFNRADITANRLLPSSHPLRLSVKLEFSAFTYDCTRDYETSRMIAKKAVDEAFSSMDPMDDESFEDAMEMVGALGAMSKRGLPPSPQPTRHKSVRSVDSDNTTPGRHRSVRSNEGRPNGQANGHATNGRAK